MDGERMAPLFSLVVATVGRTEPLRDLLRSLALESVKDFEVIVVDQNSDDRIAEILREFKDTFFIRHVRSGQGLSRARNVGIRLARGEILAFPDDDCQYTGTTLETVMCAFKLERVDIVCGVYGEARDGGFQVHPKYLGWDSTVLTKHYNFLPLVSSVGLFIRKQAIEPFLEEGPFNESMGAGSHVILGEDPELVARLLVRGLRGRFFPTIRVYHKIYRQKPKLEVEYAHSFLIARLIKITRSPVLGGRMILRVLRAVFELLFPSKRRSFFPKLKGLIDGFMSK